MNLVERLRERNKALDLGDNLFAEAANEIERLHAVVTAYQNLLRDIGILKPFDGADPLPVYATTPKP